MKLFISSLRANSVYGCTDPLSANYNPLATVDDGSCETYGSFTFPITFPINFT